MKGLLGVFLGLSLLVAAGAYAQDLPSELDTPLGECHTVGELSGAGTVCCSAAALGSPIDTGYVECSGTANPPGGVCCSAMAQADDCDDIIKPVDACGYCRSSAENCVPIPPL